MTSISSICRKVWHWSLAREIRRMRRFSLCGTHWGRTAGSCAERQLVGDKMPGEQVSALACRHNGADQRATQARLVLENPEAITGEGEDAVRLRIAGDSGRCRR